jgi:hypothetical protein
MSKKYVKPIEASSEQGKGSHDGSNRHNNGDAVAEDFNRLYDLTPVAAHESKRKRNGRTKGSKCLSSPYPVDPWESVSSPNDINQLKSNEIFFPSSFSEHSGSFEEYADEIGSDEGQDHKFVADRGGGKKEVKGSLRPTFLKPSDIHPRMEEREDDIAQLRLLAGKLNADWGAQDFMAPALARRIRDFQFAQEKRRKKYGDEMPWGILGLYDHLASIRVDVEWAEDAARRRANGEPYV